ncbi:hypothetical protein GE300_08890 [Rhodobacteraceae bacterium 2CG4]|uniref:Uncharacterized protein n=1 Tax=Halovulum marinum TaxID=2662447 RepID=A0A6L5YZL8_9RHOB|nr:hypothetical protein [Halovulum marinum]MSU89733.1 hypothetical protein [Halovulum marinum]
MKTFLVAAALAFPGVAPAEGNYGTVKGWDIDYDTDGPYCSLAGMFEGDTYISIALSGQGRGMTQTFVMADDDWRSIRDGQKIAVGISFDGEAAWDVSGTGMDLGEAGGFSVTVPAYSEDAGEFARDFKYSRSMTLHVDGREVDAFNLHGTAAAYEAMVDCQRRLIEASASADPFAASADPFAAGNDPFAR